MDDLESLDELFKHIPEGTRIVIRNGSVTFENMTPDILDIALSLNPDDPNLIERKKNSSGDLP